VTDPSAATDIGWITQQTLALAVEVERSTPRPPARDGLVGANAFAG
jgi:hypothetical protein